ncbi:hypothetical protein GBF38_016666 [Nibea albiflora]|uniref:Uncharacterized protein n=1 Tax=Nibea albiflora TaxID=240163 RepID=A0ACB7FIA0_NIBAL|nr:hypothetical protein GBF38_016666 [Nibea albiflora]
MRVSAPFTTSALLLQLLLAATSAADPSTCRGIWLFELPCTEPISALVNQVNDWSSQKCQDSQEKCMYEVVSTTSQYEVTPNDYCLIYNLINDSGLTKAQGYREICTNQMCPSKQSARCYTEE